ncbi:ABC transporter permease [Eleftheria terrae]|uniref:ABC transporter permease n=1 Tax=Eleftheria terrae TaxID=1597781 RepID=UPI00263BD5FB|nr:ABC transporter permease [Eleftheria terrae]WKB50685.1 ABC transporter permease [Eleftheria terrae]
MTTLRRWLDHPLCWPALTLLLLLALNAAFNPALLKLQWRDGHLYGGLVDILNRAAPLVLVALGMTLVIATRGIDISVGAVVAISAAIAALMIGGQLVVEDGVPRHVSRFPMPLALAAALGVALLCGLWNGLLVARIGMQPIIATLILMVAGRGVAQLLTNGQIVTVYYAPYFFIGNGFLLGLPFALFIAAAVWLALHLLLSRTALGLFVQAIGINPAAARVAGVRAGLITVCVYAFCGLMAGLAGLLVSSNVKSADGNNAGLLMELDAILAVALGGTLLSGGRFTLAGSVLGALIIQTLTSTIYSIGVPPEVNLVVKAAVVFVVMLLQSADFRRWLRTAVMRPPLQEVAR